MKPRIMFLLNSIDVDRGGLTHASLRQASVFADAGYDTQIVTFKYDSRFPKIIEELRKRKKVSDKVIFRNLFENRALYTHRSKIAPKFVNIDDATYTKHYAISKRPEYNAYRLYKNGFYSQYISLRNDNSLDFIDYFNDNRYRIKRETYNYYGDLSRVQYFSFEENKLQQQIYYDKNGKVFLTTWHNPKKNNRTNRIINFGDHNRILSETTGSDLEHKVLWLRSIVDEKKNTAVMISDTRSTDKILVNLNHDSAKTALRPHSNYLTKPDNPESPLNKHNAYAINNIQNVDALVVLTEKQRNDIVNRFGYEDKVYTIPNAYREHPPKVTGVRTLIKRVNHYKFQRPDRDMKKVVILSRFSSVKNIEHTIKAFKEVIKKVPDAKLEIWGRGHKQDDYISLIKDLSLEKSVKMKGYTKTPEKVYRSAALSVMTSNAEGFSLSVMESMANMTPVISYDIRYGPSDMIDTGKNGILIKKGDINALSDKIIYLLQHPEVTKEMGIEAKKTINTKFGLKVYQKMWLSLTEHLLRTSKSKKSR